MSIDFTDETLVKDWDTEVECNECTEQNASLFDPAHNTYLCTEWSISNHNSCKLKQISGVYLVPKVFNKMIGNYNKARAYIESSYSKDKCEALIKPFNEIKEKFTAISAKLPKYLSKTLFILLINGHLEKRKIRETLAMGDEISQLK